MTQVDLESLTSNNSAGSNDRKIVCETLAIAAAAAVQPEELPPDFPPESFCLSKEAELDWFDRNAFLERKESAKANSSKVTNVTTMHSNLNSSSQRLPLSTLKTNTTFFGSSSVDPKRKTFKPVNIRFFPTKRSESALKEVSEPEPVSPKVSCMGEVRSKKGRRGSCEPSGTKCEIISILERSKSSRAPPVVNRKTGFYSRVLSMFRFSSRSNIKPEEPVQPRKSNFVPEEPVQPRKSSAVIVEPETGWTGLGGMMRFTSGRRSESWAADEIDAVLSELGSDRKVVGSNRGN